MTAKMIKLSPAVLILAAVFFSSSAHATPHHNEAQDRHIEALANEWIEHMKSVPEPYQSWAIEQIKEAKSKDWPSIGDFYIELLNISQQVIGKSKSELAIFKRETSDRNISPFTEIAVREMANQAGSSKQLILQEKFDKAAKMKWNSDADYLNYCMKIFEEEMKN